MNTYGVIIAVEERQNFILNSRLRLPYNLHPICNPLDKLLLKKAICTLLQYLHIGYIFIFSVFLYWDLP